MDSYNPTTNVISASQQSSYRRFGEGEDVQLENVNLVKENETTISVFKFFGLCPLNRKGSNYILNEASFTLSRISWFLWHVLGLTCTVWIKLYITDGDKETKINPCMFASIGILMFIIVDPVQTTILKRNLRVIPKILKLVRKMEGMNLGEASLKINGASKVYMCMQKSREQRSEQNLQQNSNIYSDIHFQKSSLCEGWLTNIIMYISAVAFFVSFGVAFYRLFDWEDIRDEWKFIFAMVCLPFPVLTTWFCVFFIGYQRKMYMMLTKLDEDVYKNNEHIKTIGEYLEAMQKVSKKLCDNIYRFTFGINFCLFVLIGTCSMFEFFQGIQENPDEDVNGDIIYVIPIVTSIYHLYISCKWSTDLIQGQHDKLRYKLKGIMVNLLMDGTQDKQFKKVEILYKNVKDFSPMPQVFGGYRVNYQIFTAMLLFIFTYARIFYSLLSKVQTDEKDEGGDLEALPDNK